MNEQISQPLSASYAPQPSDTNLPILTRTDAFTALAVFSATFIFSLFAEPFSLEWWFDTPLGGYIKFFCLFAVLMLALFYVKATRKVTALSLFYTLCASACILPFLLNGGSAYCLFAFIYLTGAMCVSKTDSLSQSRDSYNYLFEELYDALIFPLKNVRLPFKCMRKQISFKKNTHLKGVLLGCIFSLPVIGVVFALLASGDAAFSNVTSDISKLLENILNRLTFDSLPVLLQAGFYTLICAPLVYSALFCFRNGMQKNHRQAAEKAFRSPNRFIERSFAAGFYLMLCLLYISYLFSQLSYFFGAFSGKIPLAVNMSLSEYARRGFFEMSAIAVINLMLIALGVICVKRKENGRIAPLFKGVFTFLCLFTVLLIITAMSKMALYITEMGLTHKRILVCIADILLTVIILCVLLRLYKKSFPYMKIIVSVCLAVISLYLLVGDGALIAGFNTSAYLKSYHKDFDIHTVRLEADNYHALKSLHSVALSDKEKSLDAKHWTGVLLSNDTEYNIELFEKKLNESTVKSFFSSDCLTDFLFWEYVKDNADFALDCLGLYQSTYEVDDEVWFEE